MQKGCEIPKYGRDFHIAVMNCLLQLFCGKLDSPDPEIAGNTLHGMSDALRHLPVSAFECGGDLYLSIRVLRGKFHKQVSVQALVSSHAPDAIRKVDTLNAGESFRG